VSFQFLTPLSSVSNSPAHIVVCPHHLALVSPIARLLWGLLQLHIDIDSSDDIAQFHWFTVGFFQTTVGVPIVDSVIFRFQPFLHTLTVQNSLVCRSSLLLQFCTNGKPVPHASLLFQQLEPFVGWHRPISLVHSRFLSNNRRRPDCWLRYLQVSTFPAHINSSKFSGMQIIFIITVLY
jgi:hypothetical protein